MNPTNIADIQARLAREQQQANKAQGARQFLMTLDPQPGDYALAYPAVLRRLADALARELAALEPPEQRPGQAPPTEETTHGTV